LVQALVSPVPALSAALLGCETATAPSELSELEGMTPALVILRSLARLEPGLC
jgi:hypothetical protein